MQTAELFTFAKWPMLNLMAELCKHMSAEVQGSNKCQVNSNYPQILGILGISHVNVTVILGGLQISSRMSF